jgi:hypothetical protein
MSFWDELSPGVKRYAIVAGLLLAVLLAFRSCNSAGSSGPPPPRGIQR